MNAPQTGVEKVPTPITHNLVGQTIEGEWVVKQMLSNPGKPAPYSSGGTFSVTYLCERDGAHAFLKVFDIFSAMQSDNPIEGLGEVIQAYAHESRLIDICKDAGLNRVVKGILKHSSQVADPAYPFMRMPLCYILFETADGGDIRSLMGRKGQLEVVANLELLHQVSVGLRQLHGVRIAHQDLKPSNVVIFERDKTGAKVADLGRASHRDYPAPHDALAYAGDGLYAPPEQLYQYVAPEWIDRREACDLYQLGSLLCFLFAGEGATSGSIERMPKEFWPGAWDGSYAEVMPYVQQGFAAFIEDIALDFPEWARDELVIFVQRACDPDVHRRGHPKARQQIVDGKVGRIGLDRFITTLANLAKRAMVQARIERIVKK